MENKYVTGSINKLKAVSLKKMNKTEKLQCDWPKETNKQTEKRKRHT